jgi:hypothetical protein
MLAVVCWLSLNFWLGPFSVLFCFPVLVCLFGLKVQLGHVKFPKFLAQKQKILRFRNWELNRPQKFWADFFCEIGLLGCWAACPSTPAADRISVPQQPTLSSPSLVAPFSTRPTLSAPLSSSPVHRHHSRPLHPGAGALTPFHHRHPDPWPPPPDLHRCERI